MIYGIGNGRINTLSSEARAGRAEENFIFPHSSQKKGGEINEVF